MAQSEASNSPDYRSSGYRRRYFALSISPSFFCSYNAPRELSMTAFNYARFTERLEVGSDQGEALPATTPAAQLAAPLADQLESASGEAIEKAREILAMPLDPASEQFGVVMRAQTSTMATVLATQTRADENRLRATHRPDVLAALLDRIEQEDLKLSRMVGGDNRNS